MERQQFAGAPNRWVFSAKEPYISVCIDPPDPLRKAKILLGDFESGAKISPVVNW